MNKKTEYFDWVDLHDQVIGVTAREDAHQLNLFHRAVHLYARGEKGGLILQKRSLSKDLEPGVWTVSCSGHVDRGESYEEAAVREMEEELGVSIVSSDLCDLLHSGPSCGNGYEFVWSYEVSQPICPVADPSEISDLCELGLKEIDQWIKEEPQAFASSFHCLFPLARKKFRWIT